MGLFEWLGESYNPGPVGSLDVGGRNRGKRSRISVLVCSGIALLALGIWVYLVLGVWGIRSASGLVWVSLGTVLYLTLAYFLHPKPDLSNIGWMGGLFDHPFRYSDDMNRCLIFTTVVLWPGRFVSESLVDTVGLLAHPRQTTPGEGDGNGPGA